VVARLLASGQLDPSFDGDGIAAFPTHESYWPEVLALAPDGKIVVAGHMMAPGCCQSFVARLNADGSPDSTFGVAAEVRGPIANTPGITGIVMQGTMIVVAAEERRGAEYDSPNDIVLTRYLDNGQVDNRFGASGRTVVRLAHGNYVGALRKAPNDGLWLVGQAASPDFDHQLFAARFTADGARDRSWRGTGATVLPMAHPMGYIKAGVVQPDGNLLAGIYNGGSGIKLARILAGSGADLDSDLDGAPNAVEGAGGRDPGTKDNDVFGDPKLFAMQQYRDFLGREGDAAGIGYHAARLQDGSATRADIVDNFLNAPEFLGGMPQVTRLFLAFFGRVPDYDGLAFFAWLYRAGTPLEKIADEYFSSSLEFAARTRGMDNETFVDFVYTSVLGRPADPGGRQYYVEQLDRGSLTWGRMMLAFAESNEFQQKAANEVYVSSLYAGMLRRAPEQAGFDYYVDRLDGGNPRAALVADFLASPEYRARFLP
jgi:uncharacterized delta-60 repeat protein